MVNIQSASEISSEGDGGHGTSREMNMVEVREVRSRERHQRRGGSRAGVTVTGRGEAEEDCFSVLLLPWGSLGCLCRLTKERSKEKG